MKILPVLVAALVVTGGLTYAFANSAPVPEPVPTVVDDEVSPCDTSNEDHLCNRGVQLPFFSCATGTLNPVCAALCKATFYDSIAAAQAAACAAITAACNQRVADIDACDVDLGDCLDAPNADPAVCAARHAQCYEDAFVIFDLSIAAAETGFDLAVAQAGQAYMKCIRLCCENNAVAFAIINPDSDSIFALTPIPIVVEDEVNPCDTGNPDHLCNKSFPPPGFSCPVGQTMDPVCAQSCLDTYNASVAAAQATACAAVGAACTQRVADIDACDEALADCLDAPDSNTQHCASRHYECYTDANNVFQAAFASASADLIFQVAKARQAYARCVRDCCTEDN